MTGRFITTFFDEWIDKTTQTTVAVATNTPLLSKSRNLRSGVEISVGVLRATANKHDRIFIDLSAHCFHVGSIVFCYWNSAVFYLKIKRRFFESCMSSGRHDHVGVSYTANFCFFSISKHGHQNRLSSS